MYELKLHYPGRDIESKQIYVALNLMTLSNIKSFHNSRNIYWIDGLLGKYYCLFYGIKLNKYPGRKFLAEVLSINSNDLVLMGNKSNNENIDKRFKNHYPFSNFKEEINNFNLKSIKNEIIIISLPSPLQEKLSHMLDASNTIFCIGGALSMYGKSKLIPPKIIDLLGLEFLWRLNSDTKRRLKRLFKSLFNLIINIRFLKDNYKPLKS
jgi:UDP-N-acetyl-D-mannosaminuronic acid transferase (WecB/TagA/CpsF family)